MRARLLFAFTAVSLIAAPTLARETAGPKAKIAKVLARQLQDDFNRHSPADINAAIEPVDINADGIQDWQVSWNTFGPAWCGTGGCRYQLWLGRKSGMPVRVFDRQMRGLEIEKRAGRIVFVFDFHGTECGGTGAEACPGEFTWSAKRGRMVLLPTPARRTSMAAPIRPFG
ncbi:MULTISPECIES: hypothetical protein [unclassified Novosphingobium]|uniref:hypothetical protein n=1 Tax=unclassified Novosphingobium TaxID=2644732 RepID=UPI0025FB1276|nr:MULTISPECIES: hypothetical protein [unclassified Novosphingobium]HQV02819.1 hypothetical protein [Novosphingobium sp.]